MVKKLPRMLLAKSRVPFGKSLEFPPVLSFSAALRMAGD
jgi:hypothetical protein